MAAYTDEQLKAKFDEIDIDGCGELSLKKLDDRKRIREALRELGNEDDNIDLEVISSNEFTFSDFKSMVKGARNMAVLHDVPVVGVIASSVEGNLTNPDADIGYVEQKAMFDRLDTAGTGLLDKTDIAEALRHMGKSETEIQKAIDSMPGDELDFDGFQKLFRREPRPAISWFGPIPFPNPGKIHDIPLLGALTHMTQDLVVGTAGVFGDGVRSLSSLNHEDLRRKFVEFDTNGSGELDRKEIAHAMRQLGKKEVDIKAVLDTLDADSPVDFLAFKKLVRSTDSNHAIFGGSDMITDEELKEKFDKIDADGDGEIDLLNFEARKQIRRALCELQKGGVEASEIDLEVIQKNALNFSDFKSLVSGPRKLEQLHDIPVVGVITGAVADNLMNVSDMTEVEMKAAFVKWDEDKSGWLDMTEVADALRQMGISEAHIQKVVDAHRDEEVDFEGFKRLLKPETRSWTTRTAGLTVPNPAKIHDVPVVGNITHMAQDVVAGAGGLLWSAVSSFSTVSRDDLKRTFDEVDEDGAGSGMLDKRDIGKVLRTLRYDEAQIKALLDRVKEPELSYKELDALVEPSDGAWSKPSFFMHSSYATPNAPQPEEERRFDPALGHRNVTFEEMQEGLSESSMTEAQMKAHWSHLRPAEVTAEADSRLPSTTAAQEGERSAYGGKKRLSIKARVDGSWISPQKEKEESDEDQAEAAEGESF